MEEQINIVLSLLKKITDDGKITEEEVNELRKCLLNEDGSYNINRKVADGLFNLLNTAKNKEVIDDSFGELFIDAICAYLLKDKSSTGVLDDKEVDWLVGKIESNLEIDDTIVALITKLQEGSYNSFPEKLDSAIILRRLRRILDQFSNSETDNSKEEFEESITSLNEFMERRKKVSIDEDCVTILFSIKKKLIQNKRLGFDIAKNLDKEGTAEHKFAKLFYDIVSAYVLYDKHSPYDIDDKEAKRLMARINQKATADSIDKALLDQLNNKSMGFPEMLAKARFDIRTSEVRTEVVNVLVRGQGKEKPEDEINPLDKYLSESFGCADEQKLKAELLFDLKNLTKREDFNEGAEKEYFEHDIQKKYVDQVTKYITGEESQSPNEIDKKEEEWLEERLAVSESRYYKCDEDLLIGLKKSSVNFPKSLEERLSRAMMMRILKELKDPKKMLSDNDLKDLRIALFDDDDEFKIDPKEAAEFIFKLKDIICKKKEEAEKKKEEKEKGEVIDKDLKDLFIKVVSKYLLEDKQSLGRVDPAEEEWLLAKIQSNGKLDSYDEELLDELEKRSINPPSVLHRTEQKKRKIGESLFRFRKISYIAVFSSLIASAFLFGIGALHVVKALSPIPMISFPKKVMVVDPALYNRIKSDAGISDDDIRFRKVNLYSETDTVTIKNVRLVVRKGNNNGIAGKIMIGVHNTKKIPGIKDPLEGYMRADKVLGKGIRSGTGSAGLKSNVIIPVDSVLIAKRNNVSVVASPKENSAFVEIIEAVDTFLVALVVFILGIGIYELFIRKLEKPYKIREKRPLWMRISSVDDLKSSVVKVLLIAMIVGFYKKTLVPTPKEDLLYMAIGILIISAAFCLAEISAHFHFKSSSEDNRRNQGDNKKEEK